MFPLREVTHREAMLARRGKASLPEVTFPPGVTFPLGVSDPPRGDARTARGSFLSGGDLLRWVPSGRLTLFVVDPRVDAYIASLPAWQQAICQQVRALVHATDSEVAETIKRSVYPYFVLHGNICALQAARDHVNIFLYDGAMVPDPEGIITGGHDNKTARAVAVREGETLNARALQNMFTQIIANNRAGGWRKLKAAQSR